MLLGAACVADVAARRIPNAVVALLALGGLWARWGAGGLAGAGGGLLAGGLVLAVLLLAWRLGVVGGGDVKLAAAAAVWVGPAGLLRFALFTGAAGLPVALATWVARRLGSGRALGAGEGGGAAVASPPRQAVPVAVAIALGALGALFLGEP